MTLVSTIGFSMVGIGNRGGGVGGRIGYHMGHIAVTREHISLSCHFVCLMVAILVYRLSKIMFASHRGVYMKILHVVRES